MKFPAEISDIDSPPGMVSSAVLDLPTGALIVCFFGIALGVISGATAVKAVTRPT